jgi:hypothetical protein
MKGSFLKEETNRWGGHRKDTGGQECWCLFWLFERGTKLARRWCCLCMFKIRRDVAPKPLEDSEHIDITVDGNLRAISSLFIL